MYPFTCLGLLLSLNVIQHIAGTPAPTAKLSARDSTSTACGTIVNNQANTVIFNASLAFECLTSVPFNAAVASRFLKYYNDTLQFQSTLTYLKNPPASYQQRSVDLLGGLNQLQAAIDGGLFANQYEFEAALQTLIYSAHDGHLDLFAGILSAFSFASPRDIVSLSLDGQGLPKVYLADDLFYSNYFTEFQPSAIASINGRDAIAFLSEFAALNSKGTLEANADWNQLTLSAAQDIQGFFNIFSGGATFYPGDTISFVLENGTNITEQYLAVYNSPGPTGPLQTGGDFYNFFVLGFYPASFDPGATDNSPDSSNNSSTPSATASVTAAATSATPEPTATGWNNSAYPAIADVAQEDLGTFGDGYVSGYFLNSTSVSVLSIPSFDVDGDTVSTFQTAVTQFINQTKAAGLKKVVIDLQQNYGGQILLAIDTFKHFFPNIDPFAGSRMRAHASANLMGQTLTDFWNGLEESDETKYDLASDEWVITDRINAATGQNFTNWAEFFGPNSYDGDNFTNIERYNLSSAIFDMSGADLEVDNTPFAVFGYDANPAPPNAVPPFAAEDIIILSDGICHSSCALFMEMMRHEAGVRVVVVGGTPSTGPMQAPAGSRGAVEYPINTLDANIDFTQQILQNRSSPQANFLPNRTEANHVFIYFADINLRDSIRKGETTPLQFAYEAADCRIYYTPQTVYNYTNLWQYAAEAIWTKPNLCVKDSTGYSNTGQNTTQFTAPPSTNSPSKQANLTDYLNHLTTSSISNTILQELNDGLPAQVPGSFVRNSPVAAIGKFCNTDADCQTTGPGLVCISASPCLGSPAVKQCVSECPSVGRRCSNIGTTCSPRRLAPNAVQRVGNQDHVRGFCPSKRSALKCGAPIPVTQVNPGACPNCVKK